MTRLRAGRHAADRQLWRPGCRLLATLVGMRSDLAQDVARLSETSERLSVAISNRDADAFRREFATLQQQALELRRNAAGTDLEGDSQMAIRTMSRVSGWQSHQDWDEAGANLCFVDAFALAMRMRLSNEP